MPIETASAYVALVSEPTSRWRGEAVLVTETEQGHELLHLTSGAVILDLPLEHLETR